MQGVGVSDNPRNEITTLVGRNIKLARRLAGMSQHDVERAQLVIVEHDGDGEPVERLFTDKDLGNWENGHRRPSDGYLQRIAAITRHPLSWFFESHDDLEV